MLAALISLLATIVMYCIIQWMHQRKNSIWTSPLLVCPLIIVVMLLSLHISYESYDAGAGWLTKILQPATVAFAVPLYRYFGVLKKHAVEIVVSVLFGSLAALTSSAQLAKWLGLGPVIVASLAPRSVTTPIAMDIARELGGVPNMTAVFVIITGLTGIIIGPALIRSLALKTEIAKGMMMGIGAHGTGTARAFSMGSLEGAMASLAMILAGIFTVLLSCYFKNVWIIS